MGQRANLIIVQNNTYELYYDHWCANHLEQYLFWGVDQAVSFFRSHDKQGDEYWLDTTWCEGGAVIDLGKKVLLWFGGEDIMMDIPLRRLFLELMQKNWAGFQILWAYEGIVDLADYVGYDKSKVSVPFDEERISKTQPIQRVFFPGKEDFATHHSDDHKKMLSQIKGIVCFDSKDPLETLDSLVNSLAQQDKDVKISPAAYIANTFESDKQTQENLFDRLFMSGEN